MTRLLFIAIWVCMAIGAQTRGIPQLVRRGAEPSLMVDGTPFLMFAAELHNSSSSFGSRAKQGYGLIIATGPNEFIGAGSGFHVSFLPRSSGSPRAGIGYVEEGTYADGRWVPGRRLNADENDQGKFWRFSPQGVEIEKVNIYRFE